MAAMVHLQRAIAALAIDLAHSLKGVRRFALTGLRVRWSAC